MTDSRHSLRGLLIAPDRRILLLSFQLPHLFLWLTPGGGRATGESPETCLRREIHEETGLEELEVGPLIWTRQHAFELNGRRVLQREEFHLIEVPCFEPRVVFLEEGEERDGFRGFRWWSVEEIETATDTTFVPRALGRHLRRLLDDGPPERVVDVGV